MEKLFGKEERKKRGRNEGGNWEGRKKRKKKEVKRKKGSMARSRRGRKGREKERNWLCHPESPLRS